MIWQCKWDNDTKEYLFDFYNILDNMIENMTSVNLTYSISKNFIMQMIPHHQAAIEMSRSVLHYTENEKVREIASNIIASQTRSIEDMQSVEQSCSMITNSKQDVLLYQRQFQNIVERMFQGMEEAYANDNPTTNFMREMIPHHMGAVQMSENLLRFCICPELNPILDAIITSQLRGIAEMKFLLKCLS